MSPPPGNSFFGATLADFGHATMTQNGRPATGSRPLVVVLVEYSNFPPFADYHPLEYYERLAFGAPIPPFATSDPVNPASLCDYFVENSNGRFRFDRVALVGPLQLGMLADPGPEARTAMILSVATEQSPELFSLLDVDANLAIGVHELCVVLVENIPGAWPANRINNPVVFTPGQRRGGLPITLQVNLAGAGPLTPFYQIAHELSHSLGTVDLYNVGAGNSGVTLMSSYPFFSDDQVPVHLDAWHKLVLGWIDPQRFLLTDAGSAVIGYQADQTVLLWDRDHGSDEFFLVERRSPTGPVRYDSGVAGDGAVVWRVQRNLWFAAAIGAPDLTIGGSGVWASGVETPVLTWSDNSSTNRTLRFTAGPDGTMTVAWGDPLHHASGSRHLRVFHGGNSVSAVDSGLPGQGIFFGVTAEGNLEWNRYTGRGEGIGDPVSAQNWHANTGNLIGRGFGHLLHVFGCGDGVVMAVHPNGNLYWFCYDGNGEPDITGAAGWLPNSGNIIGNGWQNMRRIFVLPRAGQPSSIMHIMAVDGNGDLRWYSYAGDGTHDPSGSVGWHQNSGNTISAGWLDFRLVHGSGRTVFGVHNDGRLLWYQYSGQGEPGGGGWHPNSGNAIGNGWGGMRHVFGGLTDVGGLGHTIMAVDSSGDLRWHHYSGNGEQDESGVQGWHNRSGTVIGTGW